MREMLKSVNHQQASQLLHNKFVVVLGDSIQRSVYKDLVVLLQKDKFLSLRQLKSKGEMSFEQDCLIEGGCLSQMTNGTEYKEVRQFQSDHHLVRFYFVTRIFSRYMESIIEDFRHGLKPDVLIVNSCVWDISRYNSSWLDDYKENLDKFFDVLSESLPEDTLVIWNLTMPLGKKIKGGFLVPEIEHKAPQLRYDVVEANFFSGTLADAYEKDVLDLHFQFRFSLHHRTKDGVHWNAIAHRRITCLLLQHIAQAWGVILPCPLIAVGEEHHSAAVNYNNREEFFSNSVDYLNSDNRPWQQPDRYEVPRLFRTALQQSLPVQRPQHQRKQDRHDFNYRPSHHFEPYREDHHQYVMRSRHTRRQYVPYTHHKPNAGRGYY
ncbi:PC-esterase domain-containing protein 1A [Melanotaenia boesemani]|uniref:PC-esterase domain-containing protein 1A n=1 Tax=Melanotaenia boesemani TaxID=1250792 RepID=UPI001C05008E|nr:PC-esterase domain-containing protein 1A [Melanotaenia boesemani]